MKTKIQRINEVKSWFFAKTKTIDKLLAKLAKRVTGLISTEGYPAGAQRVGELVAHMED